MGSDEEDQDWERRQQISPMSTASRLTLKRITSFSIYYSNFAFGCGYTILSPCVLDFSQKYETTISTVCIVFTVLTVTYLLGALICGPMYNFINRQLVLVSLLIVMASTIATLPHLPTLLSFFIVNGIFGFAVGAYDCGQVAWIIDIWRGDADVWILGQHFSYSVGTILTPVLVGPFLTSDDNSTDGATTVKPGFLEGLEVDPSPATNPMANSQLYIPFTVAAAIFALAFIVQVILFCKVRGREIYSEGCAEHDGPSARDSERPPSSLSSSASSLTSHGSQGLGHEHNSDDEPLITGPRPAITVTTVGGESKLEKMSLLFLSCCCIGSYQGMEMATMQFFPTFCHFSEVNLSAGEGAKLLFGVTLAFSIGRGVGILLVLKYPAHIILVGNFALLSAASAILLFVAQSNLTYLWVGAVVMGLGLSTCYPGFYAFLEKHLYIDNTIACIITVSGGLVSSIYPMIIGNSVEKNPSILIYVNICSIVVFAISFATAFWLTRRRGRGRRPKKTAND